LLPLFSSNPEDFPVHLVEVDHWIDENDSITWIYYLNFNIIVIDSYKKLFYSAIQDLNKNDDESDTSESDSEHSFRWEKKGWIYL